MTLPNGGDRVNGFDCARGFGHLDLDRSRVKKDANVLRLGEPAAMALTKTHRFEQLIDRRA